MSALPDVLHFSEDYSIPLSEEEIRPKVEFAQYQAKNFDFWNSGRVSRSINRLLLSESEIINNTKALDAPGAHPIEEDITLKIPASHADEKLLEFPDVFEHRLIGEKSVNTLQEWECIVEQIEENTVIAKGLSLIDKDPEFNILEIPLLEFDVSDRDAISPGVVFRLIIGFSKKSSGQRIRESICYVRRSIPIAQFDMDGLESL